MHLAAGNGFRSPKGKLDNVLDMRILLLALVGVVGLSQNEAGKRTYDSSCGRCHGGDATGGETGPNITAQIASRNDEDLQRFLREGRPAAGMPAFAGLAAPDMTALVGHLR